ncbi:MAG: cytochrome c oxidase assembly protein [Magnetospirillum sp.]|nr:cytochrome c oxidase assembly protein [Magnetospirillum sp.]
MGLDGRNRMVVLVSLAALLAMIGLVVASVPLYRLFCKITGYGGTTRTSVVAPGATDRQVTVRFDASVAKGLPWRFKPDQREMKVALGEQVLATYSATNTGSQPIVGTATFNVTPDKAGRYFNKIACFCFSEQRLEPGQSVDMPVTFYVDPALADDPYANEVTTITLSYTFFPKAAEDRATPAAPPAPARKAPERQASTERQGPS